VITGESTIPKIISQVSDITTSSAGLVSAFLYVKYSKNSDENHIEHAELDLPSSRKDSSFITNLKLERTISEFGLPES